MNDNEVAFLFQDFDSVEEALITDKARRVAPRAACFKSYFWKRASKSPLYAIFLFPCLF